jgi:hypothetical protein
MKKAGVPPSPFGLRRDSLRHDKSSVLACQPKLDGDEQARLR